MPVIVSLDEVPNGSDHLSLDDDDGKVACPECGKRYTKAGLERHVTVAHHDGISLPKEKPETQTSTSSRSVLTLAERWAQFQQGCALMVSLACTQCAEILIRDAEKDGIAIAGYCQHRPKTKRQIEQMLSSSDFMMLISAIGGTARDMIAHHSIGQKLPAFQGAVPHSDNGMQPHERMAKFMMSIPPDQRHKIIDQAFAASQKAAAREPTVVDRVVTPPTTDYSTQSGAGGEPIPTPPFITDHDATMIRIANGQSSEFATTDIS